MAATLCMDDVNQRGSNADSKFIADLLKQGSPKTIWKNGQGKWLRPTRRLSLKTILSNPIFWPKEEMLKFIEKFSDFMEEIRKHEGKDRYEQVSKEFQRHFENVVGKGKTNWLEELNSDEVKKQFSTGKFPKDGKLLLDLARAVRNSMHHKNPPLTSDDEIADFWLHRFPKLVPILYFNSSQKLLENSRDLQKFYKKEWSFLFTKDHYEIVNVVEALQQEVEFERGSELFLRSYILRERRESGMTERKVLFMAVPPEILPFVLQQKTSTVITLGSNRLSVKRVYHNGNQTQPFSIDIPIEIKDKNVSGCESMFMITDSISSILQAEVVDVSHNSFIIFTNQSSFDIHKIMQESQEIEASEIPVEWNSLKQEYQEILMDKIVRFLNAELTLRDVCKDVLVLKDSPGEFIQELAHDKKPVLLKWQVPGLPSYYINRTLICRRKFSLKNLINIINDNSVNDKFFVHCKSLIKLEAHAQKIVSNLQYKVDVKKLLWQVKAIQSDTNFEYESVISGHLLEYCDDGRLEWCKSTCSLEIIHKILNLSNGRYCKTDCDTEDDFLDKLSYGNETIIIADYPGMGKSTLFHSLATKLARNFPKKIVRFVKLSSLSQKLVNKLNLPNVDTEMLKAIIPEMSESIFSGNILRSILFQDRSDESTAEFFFDGLDEVHENLVAPLLSALKSFKDLANGVRIWISTRPQYLKMVEEHCSVIGYKLKGLQRRNQIRFLTSFWKSRIAYFPFNKSFMSRQGLLKRFASKCINYCPSDFSQTTGIPLQCLLLAEIYERRAISLTRASFAKLNWDAMRINNLIELYRKTIEKKFQVFLEKNSQVSKTGLNYLTKASWNRLRKMHMELGICTQLSEEWVEFFRERYFWCEPDFQREEILGYGIMQFNDEADGLSFLHGTFQDYFVALFVFEMMTFKGLPSSIANSMGEFLAIEIFKVIEVETRNGRSSSEFSNELVLYFLCEMLAQTSPEPYVHDSIWEHFKKCDETFKSLYNLLTLVISRSRVEMFRLIFDSLIKHNELHAFVKHRTCTELGNLVTLASLFENSMFLTLCDYLESVGEKLGELIFRSRTPLQPLTQAIEHGNVEWVKYLTKEGRFDKSTWFQAPIDPLVHWNFVVRAAHGDMRYRQIIEHMVDLDKNVLEIRNEMGETLLLEICHAFGGTASSFQYLIDLGCDINVIDPTGNTFLHLICSPSVNISNVELHEILMYCVDHGFDIQTQNKEGITFLQSAVTWCEFLPETLSLLEDEGFDFRSTSYCKWENNILIYAIVCERQHSQFQKSLIKFGCDNFYKYETENNIPSTTVLHEAALLGSIGAVKYFVEEEKFDVNMKVLNGNSPLHFAFLRCDRRQSSWQHEVVAYLLSKGAQVNSVNLMGETLLDIALSTLNENIKRFDERIIYLFERHGFILKPDICTEAFLKIASKWHILDHPRPAIYVLRYLKNRGAKLDYRNENDDTLLHLACQGCWLEGVEWLVEECGFKDKLNFRCKKGKTAIEYLYHGVSIEYKKHKRDKIAELLISYGADCKSVKAEMEMDCDCNECKFTAIQQTKQQPTVKIQQIVICALESGPY